MGITVALKPSVTSGVPNILYVEFRFQRRQTNMSQTMRPTHNSESKMTPFRVLHVALSFRDGVCKFTFFQFSQGHLALGVWSCVFFQFLSHRKRPGRSGHCFSVSCVMQRLEFHEVLRFGPSSLRLCLLFKVICPSFWLVLFFLANVPFLTNFPYDKRSLSNMKWIKFAI